MHLIHKNTNYLRSETVNEASLFDREKYSVLETHDAQGISTESSDNLRLSWLEGSTIENSTLDESFYAAAKHQNESGKYFEFEEELAIQRALDDISRRLAALERHKYQKNSFVNTINNNNEKQE